MPPLTYEVFRGSEGGIIIPDNVSSTLEHGEVFIETTHSGLCGTDEHYLKSGQVLGHEGVGIVKALGTAVTSVRIGDRVGFGYTHQICGNCDRCSTGRDQFCRNQKQYGFHDFSNGTFSYGAVWDAKCVYPIPDGYSSVDAAPMMCAGATVWTALTEFGIRPGDRVAVMGIGGLGHLAVKLAAALGYHVVVLSSSDSKRQEALGYGASEYHVFRSGDKIPDTLKPVDHLLLCGNSGVDYASIFPLMDTNGTIYPLTVAFEPAAVPMLEVLFKGIRIQGSLVASRQGIRNLLKFSATHGIRPITMTFPLTASGIQEAMQTLRDGKMRYRGVLIK